MRKVFIASLTIFIGFLPGFAATLQQLTLDEMTQQSTAIIRATITSSSSSYSGSTIYTHYKLQIAETLKGLPTAEVMVPGGVSGRYTQTFPGVPQLQTGKQYLLFLWTSSAGITHLMGLSQGLFELSTAADGSLLAYRNAIGELMLDKSGRPVRDQGVQVRMTDVRVKAVSARPTGDSVR